MLAVTGIFVLAVISAGVYCWTLAFVKLARGRPLVVWSERRAVPWAFVDLALVIIISVAAAVIWQSLNGLAAGKDWKDLTLEERRLQTGGIIVISLLTVAVGVPVIALRTGATARDFGWRWRQAYSDVHLGLIGFLMLAPPVYAIQAILISVWKPSVHPLIEGFRDTRDVPLFALSFVAAVLVAPVVEELLFRVLVQGFLEKAFSHRGGLRELFWGTTGRPFVGDTPAEIPLLAAEGPGMELVVAVEDGWQPQPADFAEQSELRGLQSWLPIGISAVVFALLHWQHGPDWVPLTALAAGMGYLYQRTHRLLPSLVVHTALNAASMWGLWVQVQEGGGAGG